MEKVKPINLIHFFVNSGLPGITRYQEVLIIIDILPGYLRKLQLEMVPMRFEDYSIILVKQGEIKINIDYIPYCIGENTFALVKERNITQVISVSEDFKGYWMIVESNLLRSLTKDERSPHGVNTALIKPVTSLQPEEFEVLLSNMERLRCNIYRSEHLYHSKLVENELTNLILEIWNFRMPKTNMKVTVAKKTGNREQIVAEFLRLIFLHIYQEREVAFYADRLCVTPIYLSRAVKHVIGFPPIKLINKLVLADSIMLLRKKDTTIQQVAEELNFPDQASFSKFFKKHTGKSPMEYRRGMMEKEQG